MEDAATNGRFFHRYGLWVDEHRMRRRSRAENEQLDVRQQADQAHDERDIVQPRVSTDGHCERVLKGLMRCRAP